MKKQNNSIFCEKCQNNICDHFYDKIKLLEKLYDFCRAKIMIEIKSVSTKKRWKNRFKSVALDPKNISDEDLNDDNYKIEYGDHVVILDDKIIHRAKWYNECYAFLKVNKNMILERIEVLNEKNKDAI